VSDRDNERCKTCGTPLGEVPFGPCAEHTAYEASLPPVELSIDEVLELALREALESRRD